MLSELCEPMLLGAFAKFRRATINFLMSVCLSAWIISAPARRTFVKLDIWTLSKTYRENSSFIKIWQD